MKKALLILIAIMLSALPAFSQKGSTVWGDYYTGHVVKTDDASREITLQYPGKDKTETFVGVLEDGYQSRLKDGVRRELKLSELTQGTRIRVYYKKISKEVDGQRVKSNLVTRIEFLGRDEFAVMRRYLKVDPATPVTVVEFKTLPEANPLRLRIVGDNPVTSDEMMKWAQGWNKREGKKYGEVSIVSDGDQFDLTLVIHKWSDSIIATIMPVMSGFFVFEKPSGLEVIWKSDRLMSYQVFTAMNSDTVGQVRVSNEGQVKGAGLLIMIELEKRLKFRHKQKER